MTDRRTVLKQLAKGAVYAAPVIYTLGLPREARAVVTSGMMMVFNNTQSFEADGFENAPPWYQEPKAAPWGAAPPWSPAANPMFPRAGGGE